MRVIDNFEKFLLFFCTAVFFLFLFIQIKLSLFIIGLGNTATPAKIIVLLLINGFFTVVNYKLFDFASEFFKGLIKEYQIKKQMQAALPLQYKTILKEKFAYYNRLDTHTQLRFEKKVHHFLLSKNFVPTNGLKEPTIEMKVLIAASAAQLTLGFPDIYLSSFTNIILHATDYINPFTRKKHQGEVNPKGSIVLSWNNFVQGYAIPTNALNLGLHEMAHALKFENFSKDKEYLFIDTKYFHYWDKVAKPVFQQIQNGEHTFLRAYAGTNSEEFFAVCVEYFFEKPHEFDEKLPRLYTAMKQILRQDPKKYVGNQDSDSVPY